MIKRINILGASISHCTMKEAANKVISYTKGPGKHQIVTANSEIIYSAYQNDKLQKIINNASLVTADGIGVVMASKIKGSALPERVAGYDLVHQICQRLAPVKGAIFLLGAKPEVVPVAADKLKNLYPGLRIAGFHHGYFSSSQEGAIVEQINQSGAQVLFVALGAPQAEFWIDKQLTHLDISVAMGVGGTFDILAGVTKRAPQIWQRVGMEWAYRLLQQPSRIGRIAALPKFTALVLYETLTNR